MRAETKFDPEIVGKRVFAFRNLHTGGVSLRSMRYPQYGRTIHHTECVVLNDAGFRVRESGRQAVIKTGKKTVHAGVVGTVIKVLDGAGELPVPPLWEATELRYNPVLGPAFFDSVGGAVVAADVVVITKMAGTVKVFAWGVK